MPALLIRTSRGPYRRRTRSAPAAPLPSSVTSIRTYPAPSPSEAGCPAAASRAAEQGGMAGGEKRAGRLAVSLTAGRGTVPRVDLGMAGLLHQAPAAAASSGPSARGRAGRL